MLPIVIVNRNKMGFPCKSVDILIATAANLTDFLSPPMVESQSSKDLNA